MYKQTSPISKIPIIMNIFTTYKFFSVNFEKKMKMKQYIVFIISIIHLSYLANAQNLVNNPNFESYNVFSEIFDSTAIGWAAVTNHAGTPDYYHEDNTLVSYGVPGNVAGNRNAFSGKAYVGFYLYVEFTPVPSLNGREYIVGSLNTPLKKDECYKVSFMYSLAENYSNVTSSDFDIFFSDTIPSSPIAQLNNLPFSPQIEVNEILDDTINWIKIERYYTAQGGETYFTLGNFKNNANSTVSFLKQGNFLNQRNAYVYLDSFSISIAIPPKIQLGNDTVLCEGQNIRFDSLHNDPTLIWDNFTNDTIVTNDSIIYSVESFNGCNYTADTIVIVQIPKIENVNLNDTSLCGIQNVTLNAQTNYTLNEYNWSTGENTPSIEVNGNDIYEVNIFNNCFSELFQAQVSFEDIEYGYNPINVFTPNGDGMNDVFTPYDGDSEEYHLTIYNRWSKLIFETSDQSINWLAEGINDGVYYYHLSFMNCENNKIEKNGYVNVVR